MNLVAALTGASGALATKLLVEKSQWPVTLVASKMGRFVYEQEAGPFAELEEMAAEVWKDADLTATIASGSVPTVGMVIMPCSANTLGKVAAGIADSLVTRAAHCQLKEGRKVVLVPRETPFSAIHLENMLRLARAGVIILPPNPGFYHNPASVDELVDFVVARILDQLGVDNELLPRWGDDQP